MLKRVLYWLVRLLFGFRGYNLEVLNTPGPVLLIPNHVSWLDWIFAGVFLADDWKFVVSSVSAETSWLHRLIMINRRTFPIDTMSPFSVKHMTEFLEKKGRLVLFAEGRISRTGSVMKLFDGTGFLLHRSHARVITCYLRGAKRLPFSPNEERKRLFARVSAHFSQPVEAPRFEHLSTSRARVRLTNWLRDQMVQQQYDIEMHLGPGTLPQAIVEAAKMDPEGKILADPMQKISYRRLLLGSELLASQWRRVLGAGPRVGVLLPNVVTTPVVLLSLWVSGKVPALLNFSTGPGTMLDCARLAGLKQVITSRAFLKRSKLNVSALTGAGIELLHLEDVRKGISGLHKLQAALAARLAPGSMCRTSQQAQDTAVVLFTSGSEGQPKGVELTHTNMLANMRQVLAVCDLQDCDRLFNALPAFHSFGLTIGTMLPLVRGLPAFLYPSPLHYRVVPTMVYFNDCTVMLSTNTFLNGYARKAHPMDFRSLRYLFAGAERLQQSTVDTWSRRFGVQVLEGYGVTECSPVISVNTPLVLKFGTAGRLLPAMEAKLEPIDGVEQGGRLLVRGPNVMRGYLNAEANAQFQTLAGWYDTGDIALLDEDRFVTILGRLKRFAKVSGEMISLAAVEDALASSFPQYGVRFQIAVVSQPDSEKGELLVAVTNESRLTLEEVRAAVRTRGLPNLAAPRQLHCLKELPHLGTGKMDHRRLLELIGPPA